MQVAKQLTGHSNIETTQKFYQPDEQRVYLPVQPEDVGKSRAVRALTLGKIPIIGLTDPKLAGSVQKQAFPGHRGSQQKIQPFD